MNAYNVSISYEFEVDGEGLAITSFGQNWAEIKETRKNGQEDTHMKGTVIFIDDEWVWEEDSGESFKEYHSDELYEGILTYLNKHGVPGHHNTDYFVDGDD